MDGCCTGCLRLMRINLWTSWLLNNPWLKYIFSYWGNSSICYAQCNLSKPNARRWQQRFATAMQVNTWDQRRNKGDAVSVAKRPTCCVVRAMYHCTKSARHSFMLDLSKMIVIFCDSLSFNVRQFERIVLNWFQPSDVWSFHYMKQFIFVTDCLMILNHRYVGLLRVWLWFFLCLILLGLW